jgi:phage-related protein
MSGGTSQTGEVAITISAVDEASDVIQNVQSNLSDLTASADNVGPAMGNVAASTGGATQSMDGLNQSTMWSMQGFMGLSSTIRMGISDYEQMELMHIRIETAQLAVTKAQEAYNTAVQKYGENSQQAIDAQQKLTDVTDRLNFYQEKNMLNYVQMGLQIPMLIASLTQMSAGLGGLGGALGSAGEAIGGVVAALGPVGIAIIAIVAAIGILYLAWTQDWGGIREITATAVKDIQTGFDQIGSALSGFGDAVKSAIGGAMDWLKANWQDVLVAALTGPVGLAYEAWKNNWGGFRDVVSDAVTGITNVLTSLGKSLQTDIVNALFNARLAIEDQFPLIAGVIDAAMKAVQGNWKGALDQLVGLTVEAFQDIQTDIGNAITAIGNALTGMKDAVVKPVQEAWTQTLDSTTQAWDQIKDKVNAQMPLMGSIIQTGMDLIHGNWQAAWQDLTNLPGVLLQQMQKDISDIMDNIKKNIQIFTDAWQAAENFLKPILTDITTALTDFVTAIEKLFQDFYDWLVGTSLWTDLWNQILDIAGKAITQLLSDLQSKLFDAMQDAFTKALQLLEDLWNKGWQTIETAFDTTATAIQGDMMTWFKTVEDMFTTAIDLLESTWQTAWQAMQSLFVTVSGDIQTAWQDFLNMMNSAMNSFWSTVEGATSAAFAALEAAFTAAMDALEGILSGAISTMEGAWSAFQSFIASGVGAVEGAVSSASSTAQSTFSSMQGATKSALSGIESAVSGTVGAITSAATGLWDALVGHSIWTDMLTAMEDQTRDSLANIVSMFGGSFNAITPGVPSGASVAGGLLSPSLTAALQGLVGNQQTTITIPITVTLDGQTISRQVEQRTVNRIASTMKVVSTVTKAA